MKLIRQIVLTVISTELKSSNGAFLVMLPAATQRQAPPSRSLWAVHDGHERFVFGKLQSQGKGIIIPDEAKANSAAMSALWPGLSASG